MWIMPVGHVARGKMFSNISCLLRTGNIQHEHVNVLVRCYCEWSLLHCNAFWVDFPRVSRWNSLWRNFSVWLTVCLLACCSFMLTLNSFLPSYECNYIIGVLCEMRLSCCMLFFACLWFGVVDQVLCSICLYNVYSVRVMVALLPFQGISKEHANISFWVSWEIVFSVWVYYSNWIDGLKLARFYYPHSVM